MANIESHFKKIPYDQLNGKQKEIFNFQKIAATFADYGFNCIKLADDWQGADFLAYHLDGDNTLRVQLKSRLTISKKYQNKKLWIAFPFDHQWYVIQHDLLIDLVGNKTTWLTSDSWTKKGLYHSMSINPGLLEALSGYQLGPTYGTVIDTESFG